MKVLPAQLQAMREVVAPLDTNWNRTIYRDRAFPRADSVKDLDKRYRWDLLWASRYDVTPLYDGGCNDAHIDTALRAIVPAL